MLVIWNPRAGSKAGLPTNLAGGDELRRALEAAHLDAELYESPSADAAVARATAAADAGVDVVVAAGGDGTAHAIARCLLGRQTALGLLPMGSAMNLARALGIPRELDKAAAVLRDGVVRAIDVGVVRDRTFFEIVSVGLTAEAFEQAQAIDREHRWRAVLELLRIAARFRRTRVELELDDGPVRTRALALAIANGPHTGFGLTLAPDALIDDGRLDIVLFEGDSPWGLIGHMLRVVGGRESASRIRHLRSSGVRVVTRRPLAVRADATDAGLTPVEVSIRAGALRVVAPPRTTPDHPGPSGGREPIHADYNPG
jgi:YegS/Rv2252/BmrU family lipid kinase